MLTEEDKKEEILHFLKIVQAFKQYGAYSISANHRRRKDFYKLPREDQALLEGIGWKGTLDKVDDLIGENAKVLSKIVENTDIFMDEDEMAFADQVDESSGAHSHEHDHNMGGHSHNHDHSGNHSHSHGHSHGPPGRYEASASDMDKVRSTLKQFARDWSEDGRAERDLTYKPMIDSLLKYYPDVASRYKRRVLIPGAGLARLGWEIAHLGFESRCNEFSHFMLLPSYYVLNRTTSLNQHTIYPFVHSFSNAFRSESVMRGISFPDVLPSGLPPGSQFSMVAGDFEDIFGIKSDPEEDVETGQWDAVLTCFFIDTAKNIVNYLRVIHRILAPGGVWINCGPLLWHFENSEEISIELCLDEVKSLATQIGFVIQDEKIVDTSYVGDDQSMLTYVYKAAFWTATKKRPE